jgi:hypothetical protein
MTSAGPELVVVATAVRAGTTAILDAKAAEGFAAQPS